MKRKIIYGILLAVCLYIGLLYHYPQTRFLIAFVILLPLMCRFSLLFWRGRCTARLECGSEMIMKGETAEFAIRLENKSFLPISRVSLRLEYQEPGMEEPQVQQFDNSMEGRAGLDIPVSLEVGHCGAVSLKVSRMQVYDFLQLTCFTMKNVCRNRILAGPAVHSMEIRPESAGGEEEIPQYYGAAENMEGYRIRRYQAGDHLHRIHWKLSAKADELQVKDFDRQAGGRVALLLAVGREQGAWDPQRWDIYLETAVSLMFSLYYAEETFLSKVMWIKKGGIVKSVDIREVRNLQECMESLLMLGPSDLEQTGQAGDGGYGLGTSGPGGGYGLGTSGPGGGYGLGTSGPGGGYGLGTSDPGGGYALPEVPPDCLCLTMDLELFRGSEYLSSLTEAWEYNWEGISISV